jgi:hypothetical protein
MKKRRLRLSKEIDRRITLDQQKNLKKPFHMKVILWKSQKVKVKIKILKKTLISDEDINEAQCRLIVRKRTYVNAVTKYFKKAVIDSGCEVHLATDDKVLDKVLTTYS